MENGECQAFGKEFNMKKFNKLNSTHFQFYVKVYH